MNAGHRLDSRLRGNDGTPQVQSFPNVITAQLVTAALVTAALVTA
jgi:hypothetical protein